MQMFIIKAVQKTVATLYMSLPSESFLDDNQSRIIANFIRVQCVNEDRFFIMSHVVELSLVVCMLCEIVCA